MNISDHEKEQISKIREKISAIDIAMLATQDKEGHLRSRPMQTLKVDADGTLWFFTKSPSPKSKEIAIHQDVNVSYADPKTHTYVSVTGKGEIVENETLKDELWSPVYKAWFPQGKEDPELTLLKVSVHTAEYWDTTSSEMVRLFNLVDAVLSGEPYQEGENEKVSSK